MGLWCLSGPEWFQLKWAGPIATVPMAVKEMVPIVIAAALWGSKWKGKTVRALCDNSAVVAVINQGSSCDQDIMHLRCLAFLEAKFEFHICTSHIKVGDNTCGCTVSE